MNTDKRAWFRVLTVSNGQNMAGNRRPEISDGEIDGAGYRSPGDSTGTDSHMSISETESADMKFWLVPVRHNSGSMICNGQMNLHVFTMTAGHRQGICSKSSLD